ncbi:hypothetical protein V1264_013652 [Littorina saxatilis]|uniref:Uncharacterized protein n=2 Tax=Littorina saxatilis TaxID=31220 RepID=A0AAN9BQH3_9CAEN
MRTVTTSPSDDCLTISACQWHSVKSRRYKKQDGHGNGFQLPRSRHKHSACCVGEYLYVLCGKEGTSPLKDVWKFHVRKQNWERIELRGGSLPFLQGHTAVAHKRLILIFGGTFSDTLGDVQLWTYNTDLCHLREVWIEPGEAQPLCRRDHSAVVYNNLMYVYGGFVDSAGANQEMWAFSIDEEEWTELTTLGRNLPGRRYGHSAVVADNAMWLYGGMAGLSPRSDLWKFSFLLHLWSKVKVLGSPPSLSGHAACVIHRQMVVVGGNCQGKPVSDVWCFSFGTSTWQKLTSSGTTLLPRLSFHSCVSSHPVQPGSQPTRGMTLSTPHLKPTAKHQLHPDHLVVRPRSSPAMAKEDSQQESICMSTFRSSGGDTQVMVLREGGGEEVFTLNSEGVGGDGGRDRTDSCDGLDARIHVSHKEPLVSAITQKNGIYNSCGPSPENKHGYSVLEGDECREDTPAVLNMPVVTASSCSSPQCLHATSTPRDTSTKSHLMDLSDSPVLKISTRRKSAETQNSFMHDLLLEDLETVDVRGIDELRISYPSKNPFLPLPNFVCDESSGGFVATGQQWSPCTQQEESHGQWHKPGIHQHWHSSDVFQLKDFRMGSVDTISEIGMQSELAAGLANQHPVASVKSQSHMNNGTRLRSDISQYQKGTPSCGNSVCQRNQQNLNRRSLQFQNYPSSPDSGVGSFETETSFIQKRMEETLSPKQTNTSKTKPGISITPAGDSSAAQTFSGKPFTTGQNLLTLPDSEWTSEATGNRDREAGHRGLDQKNICEEVEVGEPFVLVIGGRMEDHGSVHPKPIAVWKGVFL